jgi:hypothetical protein
VSSNGYMEQTKRGLGAENLLPTNNIECGSGKVGLVARVRGRG